MLPRWIPIPYSLPFEANQRDSPAPAVPDGMGTVIGGGCAMMSLPFLLFACGLGAAWLRQRGAAMGFWVAGLVVLLVLFRVHMTDVLNIAL